MSSTEVTFHNKLDEYRDSYGKTKDFYNDWATKYDEVIVSQNSAINNYAADTLSKYYNVKKNVKILDVPCGTGITGKALIEAGFRLIDGFDISQGMVDIAKEKNIYDCVNVGCITDTQNLGCKENSYDGLICVQGIGKGHIHLKDALKEFIRVLKPNAYMAYTVNLDCPIEDLVDLHNTLLKDKKLELVLMEKRFYYKVKGVINECYFCVMKKI